MLRGLSSVSKTYVLGSKNVGPLLKGREHLEKKSSSSQKEVRSGMNVSDQTPI